MEFQIEQIIPRRFRSDSDGFLIMLVDVNARSVVNGRLWSASNLSLDKVRDVLFKIVETRLRSSSEMHTGLQGGEVKISGADSPILFSDEELDQLRQ